MIPFRRFSAFISRISLTVILISTSLFVIFGLTKYLLPSDKQQYVPVGNNLLKNHNHRHERDDRYHHQEVRHTDRRV
jgi:hypothetical protein